MSKPTLAYCMVVLNRLDELKKNLRRASPNVDGTFIVDGGCFPARQKILTTYGPRCIENLSTEDFVFGKEGQEQRIKSTFVKDYDGMFVRIKPYKALPIEVTANHPILILEGQKCGTQSRKSLNINCKPWCSCGYWIDKEPIWKRADKVKKDDFVLIPKTFSYTEQTEINEEIAEILGWFLAEGNITHGSVIFSLSADEDKEAERISYLMYKYFSVGSHYFKEKNKKGLRISFHSVELASLFRYFFGDRKSIDRRVPKVIFSSGRETIRSFLLAYNKGDGSVYKCDSRGDFYNFSLNTASKELLSDIQQLFYCLGIIPAFSEQSNVSSRYTDNSIYKINLNKNDTLKMLNGSFDDSGSVGKGFIYGSYICLPVREVDSYYSSCKVYNIETEDNTYMSSFIVHNSTDGTIEWLGSQECKDMNVHFKVSKQYRLALGNHTPRERNQYLEMSRGYDYKVYADSDEFFYDDAIENFYNIIENMKISGADLASFNSHDLWTYEDGRIYDNVSNYWNPMMWKSYPGETYVGHTHSGISLPGSRHLCIKSGYRYKHIKTERRLWQNSTFLYWTTAKNADNFTDDKVWMGFHRMMQKYGYYDWHILNKDMAKGNLPQEMKEWFIVNRNDENPEIRAWFVWYFIFMHPEENLDMIGNKDLEWDYVEKARAKRENV